MGQTVRIAYYTQESVDMDENKRMIEYIKETAQVVETSDGKRSQPRKCWNGFFFRRICMARQSGSCREAKRGGFICLKF